MISDAINVNAINRFILYTNSGKLAYVTLPIINFDVAMNKIKSNLEANEDVAKVLKKNKSSVVSVQLTGNFYKTEDIKSVLKSLMVVVKFHHQYQ